MTASEVKSWNGVMTAWCDWFEGKEKKTGSFPVSSLEIVNEAVYTPRTSGGGHNESWME